ncbi:MAG: hypothetical protein EBT47_02045, partial [Chloroflexi bacterium]|nr:hypothetical protein [Chloroflexota bacterium]
WPCGTGPYKITLWSETQKFMDLRQDWWGAKTLFALLPQVERIVFTPYSDDNRTAQLLASNEVDASLDLRPGTIKALLPQNKALITHSFNRPPFGYVDWWPNSFWINTTLEPWNDPSIRWALSYAIDRQGAIDVAYEGAGQATELPYPAYPALKPYADSVKDLLAKYPNNKYDLAEVDKRLKAKGYAKDGAGFWAKGGKRLVVDLFGWGIWADIGPVVAEQLRKAGFESSYSMPPDWADQARLGTHPGGWFMGHGASIADPYYTMFLFTSENSIPKSTTSGGGGNQWSRWSNKDFDVIVDKMNNVPMGDPRVLDLFHDAMAIWLKELPNLPFISSISSSPPSNTLVAPAGVGEGRVTASCGPGLCHVPRSPLDRNEVTRAYRLCRAENPAVFRHHVACRHHQLCSSSSCNRSRSDSGATYCAVHARWVHVPVDGSHGPGVPGKVRAR